jgi:hypothetical protein
MASLPVTWSDTHPSEEGYYWFRSKASSPTMVKLLREGTATNPWTVEFLEDYEIYPAREPGHHEEWAGPLFPPA